MEWRQQWDAQFGPGSNNYWLPPEKTVDVDEKRTVVDTIDDKITVRRGFFSRWTWSRQKPVTDYKPGVVMASSMPKETAMAEKPETRERASNDTDRTLEVESAPDRLTDDTKDEKKGMSS